MSFLTRAAAPDDARQLYDLARQFTLLNLPADERVIAAKLERSEASFRGELSKDDAVYLFVAEERASGAIVGSSLILAKNATSTQPNFSFKVLHREHYSADLGVGFVHQRLRLYTNTDGPTEVGGLVVDRAHRRRPERVGRMISMSRFVYIGIHPERFEADLHSEMAPPLSEDGRSEFWEALGRRFTGMPYQEADRISGRSNAFISDLFPPDDIHVALLSAPARMVLGRVAPETEGALHLLNGIGFRYKHEVDPFDGGPHLGCRTTDCTLIKNLRRGYVVPGEVTGEDFGMLALARDPGFKATATSFARDGESIRVPPETWRTLDLAPNEPVFVTPL